MTAEVSGQKGDISVVAMILSYNCAGMLERAYEKIPKDAVSGIFVTDDGSKDGSYEKALSLGIPAIGHSPNRGYGGNVKEGLKHAFGMGADYVVEIHGDGAQFDPRAIYSALPLMREGRDFIIGSRFQKPMLALKNGMPLIRFCANIFLSFFDRLVLGLPLTEFHTGFRIYGRRLYETLPLDKLSDDYLFSFQIIAQAAYYRLRVGEVPVEADYVSEHTSHKLSGAFKYALSTFAVLFGFLGAKTCLFRSAIFPAVKPS